MKLYAAPEPGKVYFTRYFDSMTRGIRSNMSTGTNTYLIGRTNPYILLDAGQGIPEYIPLLRSALEAPAHQNLPDVTDIILSHRHETLVEYKYQHQGIV